MIADATASADIGVVGRLQFFDYLEQRPVVNFVATGKGAKNLRQRRLWVDRIGPVFGTISRMFARTVALIPST